MAYSRAPVEITLSDTFNELREEVNAAFQRLNELFENNDFQPLAGAYLEQATLKNGNVEDTDIIESTIDNSTIKNSQVNDSTIENSDVENAQINNSTMDNGVIRNTEIEDTTTFSGTHSLSNVTFTDSTFKNSTFENVTLQGYQEKVTRNVDSHDEGSTTLEIDSELPNSSKRGVFHYSSYVIRIDSVDGTELTLNSDDVPSDLQISGELEIYTNYLQINGIVFKDAQFLNGATVNRSPTGEDEPWLRNIFISDTEPTNMQEGDLWIDTSSS